jgi:Asp-tRNA(Asn)/Glu-tRNA(Gln) amidotransferase A subunit family amidase
MVRGTARSLATALTLRSAAVRGLAYEAQLHRIAARESEVKAFTEPAGDIVARVERSSDAGLLVAVKDNIACNGLAPARCGSDLPPGAHAINAGPEATIVTRLREAGCVIAGKTRLAEFAALAPPVTANPHNAAYSPGGSSSGSAAAVAAGFVDAALGTQTIGSIGRPAAFSGVAALAPTRGRVPRDGVELYSPSVDVVGAFAKDCNTLRDVSSYIYDDWEEPDPEGGVLPRKKLVVLETFRDAVCTAEAKTNFAQALAYLRDAGFEGTACAMPTPLLDDFASLARRHSCLVNAELKKGHAKRFADHGPLYRPETAALLRASYDAVYPGSMEALREELEAALGDTFAFFVAPAAATVPPLLAEGTTGDPSASLPFAHAGLPSVTLPVGRDHATNLPVCLQFVGRAGADEALLQFAARLAEKAFPALSS